MSSNSTTGCSPDAIPFCASIFTGYRIRRHTLEQHLRAGTPPYTVKMPGCAVAITEASGMLYGDLTGTVPHLQKAATDSDPAVREAAAQMLRQPGKDH